MIHFVGNFSDSPMKHDIFKQITLDVFLVFMVFFIVEVMGGMESFFDWSDFLSFRNFKDFRLSIIGQSLSAVLGYIVYYQIVEPQITNRLPKF